MTLGPSFKDAILQGLDKLYDSLLTVAVKRALTGHHDCRVVYPVEGCRPTWFDIALVHVIIFLPLLLPPTSIPAVLFFTFTLSWLDSAPFCCHFVLTFIH
jgi:hypothetical protein